MSEPVNGDPEEAVDSQESTVSEESSELSGEDAQISDDTPATTVDLNDVDQELALAAVTAAVVNELPPPAPDEKIRIREQRRGPRASDARHRGAYIEMLISSILGLIAAFVLSVDALTLAANPDAIFACDISAKISCGTVGTSWQAQVFGFPNAYLGLIFEPIVIMLAVALLGGTRFPRWFMIATQGVYTIAIGFAWWLFMQAYFVIGAMCPWCLLVTGTTLLVFMSLLRVNILEGNFKFGKYTDSVVKWVKLGADIWFTVVVLAVIAAMVIFKYV